MPEYERLRVSRYTGLDVNTAKIHMDEGASRISRNFDYRRIGAARLRAGYSRLVVSTVAKSVVATDNFNRADGALGSNWTAALGTAPTISSNQAIGPGASFGIAYWSANSFTAAQYAKATFRQKAFELGVAVRVSANGAYVFSYFSNYVALWYYTTTAYVGLANVLTTLTSGDVMEIQAIGEGLYGYVNGVLMVEAAHSALSSGSSGIKAGSTSDKLDDWEGGDLVQTNAPVAVSQVPSRLFAFERDDDETRLIVANGTRLEQFGETLPEWGT